MALSRADDFKSVLAGVTGARNQHTAAVRKWKPPIWFFFKSVTRSTRVGAIGRARNALLDEFLHARALHGHGGVIVRGIGELQFAPLRKFCGLRLQPRHVRFDPRGVDDEQINLVGKPVGVEVVNDAAAFVAHQGVLALAGRELADVVGQHVIEEIRRARAADGDFAHVRDVENAGGVADGEMFLDDAGVLHGHFPAAEINQLRAQLLVRGEKWRAVQPHFSVFICSLGTPIPCSTTSSANSTSSLGPQA